MPARLRRKGRVGVVAFTVTCTPGQHAAAGVRQIGPGWISLVLSMDPGRVPGCWPGAGNASGSSVGIGGFAGGGSS
ncbi:MAG: hypothetical protein ACRDSL_27140 [Pseudonocardiaceae bacterium]